MNIVTALARREAELLGHHKVGTEHLLLMAIWEFSATARGVLEEIGAAELVRDRVRTLVEHPNYAPDPADLTAVMQRASKEIWRENGVLTSAHFLLAIAELPDSRMGRVLADLRLRDQTRDVARRWVRD
jgi:ATP-dependent Clp protease ATP-binding subunit ClpA